MLTTFTTTVPWESNLSGGDVRWPPRSPDLSPLDVFFFCHIKTKVYSTRPTTVENMQNHIIDQIASVTPQMLQNVRRSFARHITLLIEQNGGHFEHLLKHQR